MQTYFLLLYDETPKLLVHCGGLWCPHSVLHLAQLTHCNIKSYEFINSFYALSKLKNGRFRNLFPVHSCLRSRIYDSHLRINNNGRLFDRKLYESVEINWQFQEPRQRSTGFKCRLGLNKRKITQNIAKKIKHQVLYSLCFHELEQSKGTLMCRGVQVFQKSRSHLIKF